MIGNMKTDELEQEKINQQDRQDVPDVAPVEVVEHGNGK